jgi:hypothetical protein
MMIGKGNEESTDTDDPGHGASSDLRVRMSDSSNSAYEATSDMSSDTTSDTCPRSALSSEQERAWEQIVGLWESEKVQDYVDEVWPLLKPNRDATLAEFETLPQEQKDEVTEIWHEQKVDFPFIKSPAQMYYELKRATQLEILTLETAVKIRNGELKIA